MTEYELMDIMAGLTNNSIAEFVAFVSIVSGYLVVAYLAGDKLTRAQLVTINFLYLFISTVMMFTLNSMMSEFQHLSSLLRELDQSRDRRIPEWYPLLNLIMCLVIVAASLKFMQDSRKHDSTE